METRVKQGTIVNDLKEGETRILSIRQSRTASKIQIEFAYGFVNKTSGVNLTAAANEGDSRFGSSVQIRRAWLTAEKGAKMVAELGITKQQIQVAEELGADGVLTLDKAIINPKYDGKKIVVRSEHSFNPYSQYQAENPQAGARKYNNKQRGELFFVCQKADGTLGLTFKRDTVVQEGTASDIILSSEAQLSWEEVMDNGIQTVFEWQSNDAVSFGAKTRNLAADKK